MAGFALPAVGSAAADAGCPSTGGCVDVHEYVNGVDTVINQVTPDQIAQDSDVPNGTCYEKRYQGEPSGQSNGDICISGLSMHELLADSGVDVSKPQLHTAVVRNDGTWATLTTSELQDPVASGVFYGDATLPAVYSTGNSVGYVRPLRSADDANQQDIFTPNDQSGPLDVYVFTGPTLTVTATASNNKVDTDSPVHFQSSVTSDGSSPAAGTLDYSWTLGDGSTASTPSLTHAFSATGTYTVLLTVTGKTDGSGGMSDPLEITVGNPTKASQSPKPGTGAHTPAPESPGPVASKPPRQGGNSPPHSGGGGKNHAALSFGRLPLGGSIAARLGRELSAQQPLLARGEIGQLPVVSGQVVGAGQPVSLSAAASEAYTLPSTPASATSRWSPGVIPIYVGVVLLLLGVGVVRERGWSTPRRR